MLGASVMGRGSTVSGLSGGGGGGDRFLGVELPEPKCVSQGAGASSVVQ